MNKFLLSLFLTGCVSVATAVTPYEEILADPQKAGGVYFAYPDRESKITNPPAGYKPLLRLSLRPSRLSLSDIRC